MVIYLYLTQLQKNYNMPKKVYLFDDNQNLINEFDSIKNLSEILNTSYINIHAAIRTKGFLLKKFYVSFQKELVLEKRKREMNPKIRGYSTIYGYQKHYVNSSEIRREKYLQIQKNYDKNVRKNNKTKKKPEL